MNKYQEIGDVSQKKIHFEKIGVGNRKQHR